MIIVEQQQSYLMVTQHDHAQVSGEFARNWKEEYFPGIERKQDVELAVFEHDCGWLNVDAQPKWNNEKNRPFSFVDYPIDSKISLYTKGISEVAEQNSYAGLLCSLHYASFLQGGSAPAGVVFWNKENKRQQQLYVELGIAGDPDKEKKLMDHLEILKFCDNLSLYVCLNEPGVRKSHEHPFFRNGFPQSFPFANHMPIHAHWKDQETVKLSVSPFEEIVEVKLAYKEVKKDRIKRSGLVEAYREAPMCQRRLEIK
ncbi:Protein of unknown function [Mesobacillus persicus]|uniref:DUF3891 family protein n=1 Tax=Mesobacillus persicus TaxID=930146 RepID=A0A1H8I508_9BACI|nr:DUF3891 family protein [Mesobacillus persicus]SEN62908.1 Protein of unknown function [Mesobacillus persicus]